MNHARVSAGEVVLETDRRLLRRWRVSDAAVHRELWTERDPRVPPLKVPTVVVARHGEPQHFDSVVDDDYEGARLTVDHLVRLGHTRIVHTCQSSDVIVTSYSEEGGYDAACEGSPST